MARCLFIGRWQPFHAGHKALLQTKLDAGDTVIVGIRDTERSEQNPLTAHERAAMIQDWCSEIEVCVVPDFDTICYGRGVGYGIEEVTVPEPVQAISGTAMRARRRVIWLTGNSGAGKTTVARLLAPRLRAVILDGDEMRDSISLGAGFSLEARLEHNRRVARLARELVKQTNVLVSVIAPTPEIRAQIAEIVAPQWVYVHRTLAWGEERPYVAPTREELPGLVVANHDVLGAEESAQLLLELLA